MKEKNVKVNFIKDSFFTFDSKNKYDLIYDAGLFHHIFPHRRMQFMDKVRDLLNSTGMFGLVAFNEKMGTDKADQEIYENRSMEGGISYPKGKLEEIFSHDFTLISYRVLKNAQGAKEMFGYDFVSALFWQPTSV